MGATDGQRNFAEMRKTLGQPGFLTGEDRNRRSDRLIPFQRLASTDYMCIGLVGRVLSDVFAYPIFYFAFALIVAVY